MIRPGPPAPPRAGQGAGATRRARPGAPARGNIPARDFVFDYSKLVLATLCLSAFLAAVPPRGAVAVRGRIFDAGGSPLPGTTIVARPAVSEPEAEYLRDAGKDPREAGRASTREDGRYSISLAPGRYELEISASGFASALLDVDLEGGEGEDVGDVPLRRAVPASGVVVDASGRGVPGAWVTVSAEDPEGDSGARLTTTVRTDAKGRFTAPAAAAPVFAFEAIAPGLPSGSTFRFGRSRTAASSTIRLDRSRRVAGVVRRPDGSPAAGVLVSASGHAVKSGDDGTFAIDGVSRDPAKVAADDGDLRATSLAKRDAARVELTLSPAARLAGTVLDSITRRPVPRAAIQIRAAGPRRWFTDRKGRFEARALPPGSAMVAAGKRGYAAAPFRAVELSPAAANRVEIALVPMATVEGRVLDERQKGVAAARVTAASFDGSARSAKDGAFSVFADGRNPIRIEAVAEGFAPTAVDGIRARPGERKRGITVVLTRGVAATGRVVDAAGNPIGGAKVDVAPDFINDGNRWRRRSRSSGSEEESALTNAAGRFEIAHLSPGIYRLTATHAGHAEKAVSGVRLPNGEKAIPDIVLAPAAAVEGFVRDARGDPVIGATVNGHTVSSDERVETGPDGAFRLTSFPAGARPMVFAYATGFTTARRTIEAPAKGVTITLDAEGTIRGRVEDASSAAAVTAFSIDTSSPSERRGGMIRMMAGQEYESADGSFEQRVSPGKWTVTATAEGYSPASIGDVEVAPGETKDGLVLELRRGARVEGTVVDDETGAPIPAADVSWVSAGTSNVTRYPGGAILISSGEGQTSTDAEGRFELTGLAENEKITITAEEYAHTPASAGVTTGGDARVSIRMTAGGSIQGTLAGADGRGVGGGTVDLQPLGGDPTGASESATDAAGGFLFEHLKPGTYRLTGSLATRRSLPQEVTVAPGQSPSGVTLSLSGGAAIAGKVTGLSAADLAAVRIHATGAEGFGGFTTPDESGGYEIDGAPPGEVSVTAFVAGLESRSVTRSAEIAEDATRIEVDLDFPRGGTLSGTVTRGGEPQSQVWISVQPATPGTSATGGRGTSDESGRYSIGGLEDGDYVVRATTLASGASAPHEEPVTVSGDTTLDIDLPTLSITGVVVEEGSNDPVSGAKVTADSGASPSAFAIPRSTTDSSGRFELDGLASGDLQLTVSKTGWQAKTQPVSLGDANADVTIGLVRSEGITIRAADGRTGIPLSSVDALFFGAGGAVAFDGAVALDSTGRGEIPQLPAGVYATYFFAHGYAPQAAGAIAIPTSPLTLVFTPGGELDIRSDADNTGAPATLAAANGLAYLTSAFNFDPQFALAGNLTQRARIAPGSYTLTIAWPDGPKSYPVSILEGQTTTIAAP